MRGRSDFGPRRGRSLWAILAGLGLTVGWLAASPPDAGRAQTSDAAVTPHNKEVAIFDEFAANAEDRKFLADVKAKFEQEHYHVTVYEDPREDGGRGNTATLDTFRAMAKASTIIIDSHGEQYGKVPEKSCDGKGILRDDPSLDAPGSKGVAQSKLGCRVTFDPIVQVEWSQTPAKRKETCQRYVEHGIDKKWLVCDALSDTLLPDPNDPSGRLYRPSIALTLTGIRALFQDSNIDFVDAIACHSLAFTPGFNARVAFGYRNIACAHQSIVDGQTLFHRLFGEDGPTTRTTSAAFDAKGFGPDFDVDARDVPVVFSPAVTSVSPRDGSALTPGTTSHVTVTFDTTMRQSTDLVDAQGCGVKMRHRNWTDDHTYTFDLDVPKKANGTAFLTVKAADGVAGSPGASVELDGNRDPDGTIGRVPNGDSYTWKLTCASSLDITLTGVVDGHQLAGKVGGAGARVTCNGAGGDQVITVHWTGVLPNGTRVAGEFDLEPGAWTLGPGGSAQGIISLDLLQPSDPHAAGASGGQFGTGSGTITTGATGGSVNAELDGGVTVSGTWEC